MQASRDWHKSVLSILGRVVCCVVSFAAARAGALRDSGPSRCEGDYVLCSLCAVRLLANTACTGGFVPSPLTVLVSWPVTKAARKVPGMFSDFKFIRGYCIYVLVTYAPILVHTIKECSKKDVCICSTDEGVIDLRSLAGTGSDIPR